ncbi:hypothetical protein AQZ52_10260 [Novosphingobium fuchskuhlense]|uniref:Uncharacterized protein n=1 Tax=Novosphingobium fuchskuhlense TaxID=1117702 RepID=A0A117UUG7_9SPHN|nr:hypothetical protein [Novosphingobium fuchskuhlense]KUR71068.1 hypothetical protein AQZ52_10260 [Novosphingobium fuchskuhlense]
MTLSSMDAHHLLFARRLPSRRIALVGGATALALLLSGCDVDRVNALEERVAAVEAKADAAEKKAKAAESLAVSNQPQAVAQPEPVMQNDDNPGGDDPAASIDDAGDPPPPPPMADNGKG